MHKFQRFVILIEMYIFRFKMNVILKKKL